MSRFSIRTLLMISILLPLMLVYVVSMTIDARNSREEALNSVQIDLMHLVSNRAAKIDIYISSVAQIPRTLSAALSADETLGEEDFESILRETLKTFPRIIGLSIALEPDEERDTEWYVYRAIPGSDELFSLDPVERAKKNYVDRDWYRIPKETGREAWSEPYFDQGATGLPMFTFSSPIFRDGQFAGVVMVDLCLEDIQELINQMAEPDIRYYLLSATGKYAIATDPLLDLAMKETIFSIAEKYNKPELAEAGRNMLQGKPGILAYNRAVDERRIWIAYAPLPNTGWNLKVAVDESHILEPVYESIYSTIRYFIIEFTVILIVIVLVTGRLAVPIKRLAGFAEKLATGDLEAHVGNVSLAREIDQLAQTFDTMAIDLKANIQHRLREEAARHAVEGELKAARNIQASLIPRVFPPFPERTEFDLHATNEPAAFIAGDFFDFFFIEPNKLAFVIADVSGHGIPAALFMAVSRTAIRTFAVANQSPQEIINHVNRVLSVDNDDMMFVTMFYGHYDIDSGMLTYVNAGHNPPYVVRKDGHLETLHATGPLVAALETASFQEQTIGLESGDLLVTFTDGVTEAYSEQDGVEYGEERLERLLSKIHRESVQTICDLIYRDADDYAQHTQDDDITLLVLRRN